MMASEPALGIVSTVRPPRDRPKLLYVVTPAHYFVSHRLALARAATTHGWDVHVATPPDSERPRIEDAEVTVHPLDLRRSIASPVAELRSLVALLALCRRLRPDLIHAVSPKGAVYGGIVARLLGIPAVVMKGGLGSTSTESGALNRLAGRLVRAGIALGVSPHTCLVVQNDAERADLAHTDRLRARTVIVQGAGVNCSTFRPSPEPDGRVTVVLPARMLRSKGVPEFVEAARLLVTRRVDARFQLAGAVDPVNSCGIAQAELRTWERDGAIEWLGHRADMPRVLASCHIVCLPSHGEGLPKALAEAAAAGRPIVASDVPGCREVVQPGVNGLLVPPRDPQSLADALSTLIADRALRVRFGEAGRRLAVDRFDERIIHERMLAIYRELHRPLNAPCRAIT